MGCLKEDSINREKENGKQVHRVLVEFHSPNQSSSHLQMLKDAMVRKEVNKTEKGLSDSTNGQEVDEKVGNIKGIR